MLDSSAGWEGVPAFHVHPEHAFEGFELVECPDGRSMLQARCDCGAVLDVAEARFAACPECPGRGCVRCEGTGRIVDHAALEWRLSDQNVP